MPVEHQSSSGIFQLSACFSYSLALLLYVSASTSSPCATASEARVVQHCASLLNGMSPLVLMSRTLSVSLLALIYHKTASDMSFLLKKQSPISRQISEHGDTATFLSAILKKSSLRFLRRYILSRTLYIASIQSLSLYSYMSRLVNIS